MGRRCSYSPWRENCLLFSWTSLTSWQSGDMAQRGIHTFGKFLVTMNGWMKGWMQHANSLLIIPFDHQILRAFPSPFHTNLLLPKKSTSSSSFPEMVMYVYETCMCPSSRARTLMRLCCVCLHKWSAESILVLHAKVYCLAILFSSASPGMKSSLAMTQNKKEKVKKYTPKNREWFVWLLCMTMIACT
jgi:hypothetical protein